MKTIFSLFLICITVSSQARIIVKGSGKGIISVTSMEGLKPGDTIGIKAGTYSGGGTFAGINNITIINYGGVVTFTSSVDFGAGDSIIKNITWSGASADSNTYGFVFDATGTYGNGPIGYTTHGGFVFTARHYVEIRFNHIWFKGLSGNAFELSGNLPTYDGTQASLGLYKATFSHCRTDNTGEFYQGPYKTPNLGFEDSIDISYNIFNQTSDNGLTVNGEMTNFNIHHNKILFSGYNAGNSDVGVFSIAGFGQLHHNYMKGGRGWLARISGCSFKPFVNTFFGYNNIKIGTTTYGVFDLRTDTTRFASISNFFQHCNFEIANNTFGNLTANDGNGKGTGNNYNTPVALFYVMDGGATAAVRNNLGFNSIPGNSGGYVCVSFSPDGFSRIDTSNNKYYTASTILEVLSDTNVNCAVRPEADIKNIGAGFSYSTTDDSGKIRTTPPVVNAEQLAAIALQIEAAKNYNTIPAKLLRHRKLFFAFVTGLIFLLVLLVRSIKFRRVKTY